jgi:hypothetical protein
MVSRTLDELLEAKMAARRDPGVELALFPLSAVVVTVITSRRLFRVLNPLMGYGSEIHWEPFGHQRRRCLRMRICESLTRPFRLSRDSTKIRPVISKEVTAANWTTRVATAVPTTDVAMQAHGLPRR